MKQWRSLQYVQLAETESESRDHTCHYTTEAQRYLAMYKFVLQRHESFFHCISLSLPQRPSTLTRAHALHIPPLSRPVGHRPPLQVPPYFLAGRFLSDC